MKHNRRGYTMVELVVTFAMLTIFSTAVVAMLTNSMKIYASANSRATATLISETIMDKVCGEIAGAQSGTKAEYTMIIMDNTVTGDDYLSSADYSYIGTNNHACTAFCNRTGSPIYITVNDDGYLLVHYRPVNDNNIHLDATDWTFDPIMYRGYIISELNFEIMYSEGKKTNVIKVTLTIRNNDTGYEYSSVRYSECYNFSQTDISKIEYNGIKKDNID